MQHIHQRGVAPQKQLSISNNTWRTVKIHVSYDLRVNASIMWMLLLKISHMETLEGLKHNFTSLNSDLKSE